MKIIVCMKQVPDTTEVRLDPVTNTLIRDGVPSILNPDDKCGIEAALQIKEQFPGTTVTVENITQGAIYDSVTKALAQVVDKMDHTAIFEFTATRDGKAVQPDGALSVTFGIPQNLTADHLKLFYVSEDGKYQEVEITVDAEARTVTADLTHFSTYVLANVVESSGSEPVPPTGDHAPLMAYLSVMMLAAVSLLTLAANKRKA